jgi:hypothetical protein
MVSGLVGSGRSERKGETVRQERGRKKEERRKERRRKKE